MSLQIIDPSQGSRAIDEGTRTSRPSRISGKTNHPEPPGWVRALAFGNDGADAVFRELRRRGATGTQLDAFEALSSACARHDRPGTYESIRTMADRAGMKVTPLRKGLKWLEQQGIVAYSYEAMGKRNVHVKWALWLLPSGRFDRESYDLGQGVMSNGKATSDHAKSARSSAAPEPRARAPVPQMARAPVPPSIRNGFLFEIETTTDGGKSSWSFSTADADGREREPDRKPPEPAPLTVSAPPPPSPEPIDPAIQSTIEAEVPDPLERALIEARVPVWLALSPLVTSAWLTILILEATAARQKRRDGPDPIRNVIDFAGGTLADWIAKGYPTVRAAKPKLTPTGQTPEQAQAEAMARELARAEKQRADRAAENLQNRVRDQWKAMAPNERRPILDELHRLNPSIAEAPPRFRETAELLGCLEILAMREAAPS